MTDYSKMFKAYDMRGTVPHINAKVYYWLGYGLIEAVLRPENLPLEVNVMHDCRYSSPEFYKALCNGIAAAGGTPVSLGIAGSDLLYAACQVTKTPGVIVTASHNPKDDNGAKIVKIGSTMLGLDEGLGLVRDFVLAHIDQTIDESTWVDYAVNETKKNEVVEYFRQKLLQVGKIAQVDEFLSAQGQKMKIAVDAGNGMGGYIMPIIKDLYKNIEFIPLYWELDGDFPNHPADPQNFENLRDLREVVKNPDVNFGFAFDGDADRVFFVDENADVVQGDYLVSFFAKSLLEAHFQNPNPEFDSAVVYIQPGSRCVPEQIAQSDGVAVPSKQGHASIKATMKKYRAIYGGEFSGHHYFADFGYMDSGALAAVLMIKIIALSDQTISQAFKQLSETYFISDLHNLRLKEGQSFDDVKKSLESHFTDAQISYFDGISVFYPDWKFSMRASNTEPVVRFILETRYQNTVDEKLALVKKVAGLS